MLSPTHPPHTPPLPSSPPAMGPDPPAVRVDARSDAAAGGVVRVERVALDRGVVKVVGADIEAELQLELAGDVSNVLRLRVCEAEALPGRGHDHGPGRRVAVAGRLVGVGRARDERRRAAGAVEADEREAQRDVGGRPRAHAHPDAPREGMGVVHDVVRGLQARRRWGRWGAAERAWNNSGNV